MSPCFGDILVNGTAAFAVSVVFYLGWLDVQQRRERRKEQKEREKQRRRHWGYE